MSSQDRPQEIPVERPAQYDSEDPGTLRHSVNLFRGSLSYQRPLARLAGKLGDDTLDVELGLSYDSSIHLAATTWNLDAPTGIVGLGWSLPLERIVATTSGSLSITARQFAYEAGGASNLLIPTIRPWLRALLDPALSAQLGGPVVTPELVAAFGDAGLELSPQASVSASGAGSWLVDDARNQRTFELSEQSSPEGTRLAVAAGGLGFELQNYNFWQIRYYPAYERWDLVDESGVLRVFGGDVATTDAGFATSAGNGIEWGVRFGGARGNWIGSSTNAEGQAQYARAWRLVAREDRFGDRVSYRYNEFPRGSDGLLPVVEQRVGANGLPYTKACYLTSITGIGGTRLELDYAAKWFTDTVREYQAAHAVLTPAAPGSDPINLSVPNAFQDCYETRYLTAIRTVDASGVELYRVELDYATPQALPDTAPEAVPDRCKRFLTGITQRTPDGRALPGYRFEYGLAAGDANPGALRSMTYPEGATGIFSYADAVPLAVCERAQTIEPPQSFGSNHTPYVWLGADYAVTCWLNAEGTRLSITVHTWTGRWQPSTVSGELLLDGETPIELATISGVTSGDFFGIAYRVGDEVRVHPFRRSTLRRWEWEPYAGIDASYMRFPTSTGVRLAAGTQFLLVTVAGFDDEGDALYRLTWDWQAWTWVGGAAPAVTDRSIQVLAQEECYLLWHHQGGEGTLTLAWLGCDGQWYDGGSLCENLGVYQSDMVWAAGSSFVVWTNMVDAAPTGRYVVQIRRWDADYQFQSSAALRSDEYQLSDVDRIPAATWPPFPVAVGDSGVGVDRYLWRFDGMEWKFSNALSGAASGTSGWLAFAYGDDISAQVLNQSDGITSHRLAYDPNGAGFDAEATALPKLEPNRSGGFPSAVGGDFLIATDKIFFRGSATTWTAPRDAYDGTPAGTDSLSVVNATPQFVAWRVTNGETRSIAVAVLHDGHARATETVPGETYDSALALSGAWTSPRAGKSPGGPGTLVTYAAGAPDFDRAAQLTLHRYAGQALQGPLVDYPVRSLEVATGYGQALHTAWRFDRASAGCDPSGRVIQYYRSTAWDGCDDPVRARNGRTVTTYHNGVTAAGLSMLDGQPLQTIVFAGVALFAAPLDPALGLTPDIPPGTPVPPALAALFPPEVALSGAATYEARQVDGQYLYWTVHDASTGRDYNIDSDEDPGSAFAVRGYTGGVVDSSTNTWDVFTTRAGFNARGELVALGLHGGYVRPSEITAARDGAALVTRYDYVGAAPAPLTGTVVAEAFETIDVYGHAATTTQMSTPAALVPQYRSLAFENLLTAVAQLRTQVRTQTDDTVATSSCSVTTFAPYAARGGRGLLAMAKRYDWAGSTAPDAAHFPFDAAVPPPQWHVRTNILARDDRGIAIRSADPAGILHSTRVDPSGLDPQLLVTNADLSADEADACGFESGENSNVWTFRGGAVIDNRRAHTGACAVRIPRGGGLCRAPLTPANDQRTYVAGCFYARPSASDTTPMLVITVTSGDVTIAELCAPLCDGSGHWAWAQLPIALDQLRGDSGATGALAITVALDPGDDAELWVDDFGFYPLASQFSAITVDPATRKITARIGSGGATTRIAYDPAQRVLALVRANGSLRWLKQAFSSRQRNAIFEPNDPNTQSMIRATRGGSLQTFLNGDVWHDAWTASPADAWVADRGVLRHDGISPATLTAASIEAAEFGLYFEITGNAALSPGFGIAVGTRAAITWDDGWTLLVDGAAVAPVGSGAANPASILLIVAGGRLLFWVDGGLVFSVEADITGTPVLTSGAGSIALRNLAWIEGPSLQMRLQDSTGADRQRHMLGGASYLIHQIVQDEVGRDVVTTKNVPGAFGSGAALAPLLIRPALVDVDALLVSLDGTGTMIGDAADYWSGDDGRSDDAGYPYTRERYEASPLERVIESGLAGADWAIISPYTAPANARPTTKIAYGAAPDAMVPGLDLPAALFRVVTQIDGTGRRKIEVRDAHDRTLARIVPIMDRAPYVSASTVDFVPDGIDTRLIVPDGWADGSGSGVRRLLNGVGQLLEEQTPDSGLTRYAYDRAGRVRFVQSAADADDGRITFLTVDPLGRNTARGWFEHAWDPAVLAAHADDPDWPLGDPAIRSGVTRKWSYDGDGADPHAIGQLVADVSTQTPLATVHSHYRWTALGELAARTLTVVFDDGEQIGPLEVGFGYDNTGATDRLDLPAAVAPTVGALHYQHDASGNVVAITDRAGSRLAHFNADAMGRVTSGNAGPVTWALTYDSPGHILRSSAAGTSGAVTDDYTYSADSNLVAATRDDVNVQYGYDQLGRILSADGAHSEDFDYGPDLNGNLHVISGATLCYINGTNRLDTASRPDAGTIVFSYRADGAVSARRSTGGGPVDLEFVYAPAATLPATVIAGGTTIEYAYDCDGMRVAKRVASKRSMTFPGPHRPLFRVGSDGTELWAPAPACAMLGWRDGEPYYAASDRLSSTRAVFSATGVTVAEWTWSTFGALLGEDTAPWMRLRYTGAEWDPELELYNLSTRLYDPRLGRFYSTDPMHQFGSPYCYTGNHPLVASDLDGQMSDAGRAAVFTVFLGLAIVGGVGGLAASGVLAGIAFSAVGGAGWQGAMYALRTDADDWSRADFWKITGLGLGSAALRQGITSGLRAAAKRYPTRKDCVRGNSRNSSGATASADTSTAARLDASVSSNEFGALPEKSANLTQALKDAEWVRVPASAVAYGMVSVGQTSLTNLIMGKEWHSNLLLGIGMDAAFGALVIGGGGAAGGAVGNALNDRHDIGGIVKGVMKESKGLTAFGGLLVVAGYVDASLLILYGYDQVDELIDPWRRDS